MRLLDIFTKDKVLSMKIGALIVTTGLVVLGAFYFKQRPQEKPDVLGENVRDENKPGLIDTLRDSVSDTLDSYIDQAKKAIDVAEFQATRIIEETASKSAEAISHTVIQNTIGPLIKQIERLPQKEQEELKKNICK